jgi:DNA-binding GntR family transcriptional regulator
MADEVADRVRDAILSGGYPPGAALREVELAGALRVSRGPVREALLRLEREGLVQSEWHRGTTVTALSAPDVAELHTLRGALETLAVDLVTQQGTSDLAPLHAVVDAMDRAPDAHTTVRLDVQFHDAVFAAAAHRRLVEAWDTIRSQVHLYLLLRLAAAPSVAGYSEHVATEHRELADALAARDTGPAQRLFALHRRHAFDIVTGEPAS